MNKTPSEMTQQELYLEIARLAKENDKLKRTKKFGLVWENKNDAKVEEVRRSAPILVEDSSKRVINDPNDVNHVLINGDNFQAMTALRATHADKVDVIYIDPPYNTGNKDFIYNDKFVDAEDGYRHSLWLSFMQKRLILARELLSETGVIFVSIDDNEQARLKLLMDDIFGPQNFVANMIWSGKTGGADDKFYSTRQEYILSFCKNANFFSAGRKIAEDNFNLVSDDGLRYKQQLLRKWGSNSLRSDRPNMFYPIIAPDGAEVFPIHSDGTEGCWRWGKSTMEKAIHETPSRVSFKKNSKNEWIAYENIFENIDNPRTTPYNTLIESSIAITATGTKEINEILGKGKFSYPKSTALLKEVIKRSTVNPNAVVLDFFAGSGTTAHAVAELNKEDGGRRQCILITDGGKTETSGESSKNAGENAVNIAEEITYERVKRVLTGKDWADGKEHEPLGGNLFYLNTVVKYVGTIDAKSKEPYFCPSNSTAFSLDTGVWHPILEEVGASAEWPFQKRDYKLFALPKGEDGKQNYALTINTSDWEFTAFKEWFDKNMPEDSTVFLYADSFSHAGCEWMEELEMVKDPRLAEVNITKRLINNHNWVAHSFLKTDI